MIVRTAGDTARVLVRNAHPQAPPLWTPEGHVFFLRDSLTVRGSRDLWVQQVADGDADGEPILLTANVGFGVFDVTDRGELYQSLTTYTADVYTASIDLTGRNGASAPSRISATEVGQHVAPSWSPDGRAIAYFTTSQRGIPGAVESRTLTVQDIASGQIRRIEIPLGLLSGYRPAWAPDGGSVVVFGQKDVLDSNGSYYRVDLASGALTTLATIRAGNAPPFSGFSPDGAQFLYVDPAKGIVARDLLRDREELVLGNGPRTSNRTLLYRSRWPCDGDQQLDSRGRWVAHAHRDPGRR